MCWCLCVHEPLIQINDAWHRIAYQRISDFRIVINFSTTSSFFIWKFYFQFGGWKKFETKVFSHKNGTENPARTPTMMEGKKYAILNTHSFFSSSSWASKNCEKKLLRIHVRLTIFLLQSFSFSAVLTVFFSLLVARNENSNDWFFFA